MKAEEFLKQNNLGLWVTSLSDQIVNIMEQYAELKLQEYKDTLEEIKQRTKKIW